MFLTNGAFRDSNPLWQPIPNQAPVTNADTLTVPFNTAGEAAILANDTDEETLSGSNLSITVNPVHGSASVNASTGKISYTPTTGYAGADSLTYRICDSFTLDQRCATGVLGITVAAFVPTPTPTPTPAKPGTPVLTKLGTLTAVPTATQLLHRPPAHLRRNGHRWGDRHRHHPLRPDHPHHHRG